MSVERVVEAAIKIRGIIVTGSSHKVAVWAASRKLRLSTATVWRLSTRGFVTSRNRFVSRRVAARIALGAGQIRECVPELCSEMLR